MPAIRIGKKVLRPQPLRSITVNGWSTIGGRRGQQHGLVPWTLSRLSHVLTYYAALQPAELRRYRLRNR